MKKIILAAMLFSSAGLFANDGTHKVKKAKASCECSKCSHKCDRTCCGSVCK